MFWEVSTKHKTPRNFLFILLGGVTVPIETTFCMVIFNTKIITKLITTISVVSPEIESAFFD